MAEPRIRVKSPKEAMRGTLIEIMTLISHRMDTGLRKDQKGKVIPRYIVNKAEEYVKKGGFGDTVYFGPEAEFFIFDNIRYDSGVNFGFYEIDSASHLVRHRGHG